LEKVGGKVLSHAPLWAPIVHVENKQDMLDTSITLLWSAISSVGFLPVDTCRSWVSWCDRFGPERGYLQKGLWSSSQ